MLPIISGGHSAYQDTFVSEFLKYYPKPYALSKSSWDTIIDFWYLDLSLTDILMQDCYSKYGPEPRLTSCMLRSYLLSIKFKVTSVTDWAAMLKECPLYAILSGFDPHDTPGVGTFYDFLIGCGSQIKTISLLRIDSQNLKLKKEKRPEIKHPLILTPFLPDYFHF